MLACNPSAMARPAASSAPVFRREPDDSCKRVFCSDACVIDNWFCAARDETLFRILSDISKLLCWVSACYPCGLTDCQTPLRSIRWCCLCGPVYRHFLFGHSSPLGDVGI